MWHLRTCFTGGLGSAGLIVVLDYLNCLFQLKKLCDSSVLSLLQRNRICFVSEGEEAWKRKESRVHTSLSLKLLHLFSSTIEDLGTFYIQLTWIAKGDYTNATLSAESLKSALILQEHNNCSAFYIFFSLNEYKHVLGKGCSSFTATEETFVGSVKETNICWFHTLVIKIPFHFLSQAQRHPPSKLQ